MTLRLRLFLLVAGLVVLLVIAQAVIVRSLAARLDRDVHAVAVTVGEEILSGFVFKTDAASGELEAEHFVVRRPSEAPFGVRRPALTGGESAPPQLLPRTTWTFELDAEAKPDGPGGPDGGTQKIPAGGATWLEHQRIEIVSAAPNGEPQRFFEEQVWVGTEPRPRTGDPIEGRVMDGRVVDGRVMDGQATEGAKLSAERREDVLLPMKRPSIVPDGHGALLVRGPRIERRIPLPPQPLAATLDRFRSELALGSVALLALGLLVAAFVAHRITRPLDRLTAAAERVGGGELGAVVPTDGAGSGERDEIGAAIASFNAMSARLAALDRENRRLAESEHLSELAEVARGLAHTLRNPLNALGLAVEQIAEEKDPARAGELAERSRRQIRRIDGSLRSFLALASSTGGANPPNTEPVELGALARETALEALHDAAGRVRIEVDAPEPIELLAVAAEVKAVVQALLVNACEASPEGGRVVVRVAREGDGSARIEIDDEGAGVAPEIAGRLFAPHVTTKPHGSGMGLYLAQRLATHRYGGGVTLEPRAMSSRDEPSSVRGTRATLRLADRTGIAA